MSHKSLILSLMLCVALLAADAPAPYRQDFQKLEVGSWPDDEMMQLNGKFAVQQEGDNRFAQLPGNPLDHSGFAFGPDGATQASARIRASNTGKRFPEFGLAVGGPSGYRLWVMPATGQLQIVRHEEVQTRVPFTWKAGEWTHLKLRVRAEGDKWVAEGKAWMAGQEEPAAWMIRHEGNEAVVSRPTVWGTAYSSKPIDFDDLTAGK